MSSLSSGVPVGHDLDDVLVLAVLTHLSDHSAREVELHVRIDVVGMVAVPRSSEGIAEVLLVAEEFELLALHIEGQVHPPTAAGLHPIDLQDRGRDGGAFSCLGMPVAVPVGLAVAVRAAPLLGEEALDDGFLERERDAGLSHCGFELSLVDGAGEFHRERVDPSIG